MRAQVPLYSPRDYRLEQGVVTILDSKRKDPQEYADMTEILEK